MLCAGRQEIFGGSELAAALANVQLDEHGQANVTHLLCISPDAPTNPVLYYLSTMDKDACRFQLEGAKGPLRLDLGDVLYAPNCMNDPQVHAEALWMPFRSLSLICLAMAFSRGVDQQHSCCTSSVFDQQTSCWWTLVWLAC